MAEWTYAPAVEAMARALIGRHHTRLADVEILYLFREGPWKSHDKDTWAKTSKVSERDNFITGNDVLLVVNKDVWEALKPEQQEALIDHELTHITIDPDDGKIGFAAHDLEEFSSIVRRHGAWQEDVSRFLRAAEEGKIQQLKLPVDDPLSGTPQTAFAPVAMPHGYEDVVQLACDLVQEFGLDAARAIVRRLRQADPEDGPGPVQDVDPVKLETAVHNIREHMRDDPDTGGQAAQEPASVVDNVRPIRAGFKHITPEQHSELTGGIF